MDASARELRDFVDAHARQRLWALGAATAAAMALGTLVAASWPSTCDAFTDSVCNTQGDSDACAALRAMAEESLEEGHCREASAVFETIESLPTGQVARYTGIEAERMDQWAELRMVLKFRVAQLVMRGHWPRQALQSREAFERVLRQPAR